jgi:hypothetical protein
MKRRKRRPQQQLSLLEPRAHWSNVPADTRQKVVDGLAQLLVQKLRSSSTTRDQESTHESR